jgi:hypothetical protein
MKVRLPPEGEIAMDIRTKVMAILAIPLIVFGAFLYLEGMPWWGVFLYGMIGGFTVAAAARLIANAAKPNNGQPNGPREFD